MLPEVMLPEVLRGGLPPFDPGFLFGVLPTAGEPSVLGEFEDPLGSFFLPRWGVLIIDCTLLGCL